MKLKKKTLWRFYSAETYSFCACLCSLKKKLCFKKSEISASKQKKNKLLLGKKIVFTPIKDISLISCSLLWVWLFGFINWVDNLTWLLLKLLSVRKKIKHLSLFISIFIKDMISVLSLNYFPDDAFLISQSNNELYQYKHITAQT